MQELFKSSLSRDPWGVSMELKKENYNSWSFQPAHGFHQMKGKPAQ